MIIFTRRRRPTHLLELVLDFLDLQLREVQLSLQVRDMRLQVRHHTAALLLLQALLFELGQLLREGEAKGLSDQMAVRHIPSPSGPFPP